VTRGDKVVWVNRDDEVHTVASTAGVFRSSALDTSDAFSFTFRQPGVHTYFCTLHPHMTGTIVVK
jgi:plastocyanin